MKTRPRWRFEDGNLHPMKPLTLKIEFLSVTQSHTFPRTEKSVTMTDSASKGLLLLPKFAVLFSDCTILQCKKQLLSSSSPRPESLLGLFVACDNKKLFGKNYSIEHPPEPMLLLPITPSYTYTILLVELQLLENKRPHRS